MVVKPVTESLQKIIARDIVAQLPKHEAEVYTFESVLEDVKEEGLQSYNDFRRYYQMQYLSEWYKDVVGSRLNLDWRDYSLASIYKMTDNYREMYDS